jgi:pSer/pThr/pTyr-binding forkhead associated (FHA) protein
MHLLLVSLPGPTNNAPALRALEFGVIILLWLFFMWVVRAVWVEVRPLKRRKRRRGEDTEVGTTTDRKGRKGRVLRLHVIRPEDQAGRTYDIGDEVTVGRAPGCGVPIDYDTYSSNLHARLFRLDGNLWAEDLGSTNGTWVNTVRIGDRTRLEKGDLLQVGGTVFEVGR